MTPTSTSRPSSSTPALRRTGTTRSRSSSTDPTTSPNSTRTSSLTARSRRLRTGRANRRAILTSEATYEWIIAGLETTWGALARTLQGRSEVALAASTPCPGWSVRDVVSHLIGIELVIQGEPWPVPVDPWPPHVRNELGALNEAVVESRRARPGGEVVAEFVAVTTRSLERLRGLDLAAWEAEGWSPEGPRPHHRFQETRLLDSWIHLQDVRDALLEPGDDHGPGEEVVVNRLEAALPYVWGKRVGALEGQTLRVNLVGRLARSVTLTVADGRARAVEY
ncbi:MAG: maleylpyruvate isomerase family protein, partial [Acidimicrobiaceae bacterium]|nr:maleylpyruvate isomerase family protein [Acidimicrobiaceae bacterium]